MKPIVADKVRPLKRWQTVGFLACLCIAAFVWVVWHSTRVSRDIGNLNDSDPTVREKAALALGESKDPRAPVHLIAALKDSNHYVREAATEALGKIGTPVVKPLVAALKDRDPRVRCSSAIALDEIGDKAAVEPLIAALKDGDLLDRGCLSHSLSRFGDPRAFAALMAPSEKGVVLCAYAYQNADPISAAPVKLLIAALNDKNNSVRACAARALLRSGDSRAVDPLIITLHDVSPDIRVSAAEALGRIASGEELHGAKDYRVVGPLFAALRGKQHYLQRVAFEALEAAGEADDEASLIDALNRFGSKELAQGYLDSGNPKLQDAARAWAVKHGYFICHGPGCIFD